MSGLAFAFALAPSLAEPDGSSPFVAAALWIEGVALGSIATSIAVIAVASVGFLMLGGRLPVRRGITVAGGCFILFGAPVIASGIINFATDGTRDPSPPPPVSVQHSRLVVPTPQPTRGYDPYAGAAVPQR
ncbi:TrbC/VirB2 family protein [Sphingomonas sp. KR3-1]|uniref:TrbC/VirB2 family protein n=1 Tax=Sphingomonas sp. KR3-1 TaxID=3156611 RepID=UPI0032B580E8